MRIPRVRFTIGRIMVAVAVVAVAFKVLSELAGIGTPSWWFVGLLVTMFGCYLVTAFACGLVLDLIAPLFSRVNRPRDDPAGPPDRAQQSKGAALTCGNQARHRVARLFHCRRTDLAGQAHATTSQKASICGGG